MTMKRNLFILTLLALAQMVMAQQAVAPFTLKAGSEEEVMEQLKNRVAYLAYQQRDEPLPPMTISYGVAKVHGRILDYKPGLFEDDQLFYADDSGAGVFSKRLWHQTRIDENGEFEFEMPLARPAIVVFSPPVFPDDTALFLDRCFCFVSPGQTTQVFLPVWRPNNKVMLFRDIYVTDGPLASIANELNRNPYKLHFSLYELRAAGKDVTEMNIDEIVRHLNEKAAREMASKNFSKHTRQLLELEKRIEVFQKVESCLSTGNSLFFKDSSETARNAYQEKVDKWSASLEKERMDYVFKLWDDPMLMWSRNFFSGKIYLSFPDNRSLRFPKFLMNELEMDRVKNQIAKCIPLTADELDRLPAPYRAVAEYEQRQMLDKVAEWAKRPGYTIRKDLPEVVDSLLLKTLCKRYEGRWTVIAIWYPGIYNRVTLAGYVSNIQSLQKEFADADIAWVHLGCLEDNASVCWNNQLPRIKGDHYGVSRAQADALELERGIRADDAEFLVLGDCKLMLIDPKGQRIGQDKERKEPTWMMHFQNVWETFYEVFKQQ